MVYDAYIHACAGVSDNRGATQLVNSGGWSEHQATTAPLTRP